MGPQFLVGLLHRPIPHLPEEQIMKPSVADEVPSSASRPVAASGFGRVLGALSANPYYRTYWFGNQAGTLVFQMQIVAQGYLAYQLTGSATALGVVGLASGLPQLLLAPISGVIADRYAKRNLLLVAQGILCLSSLAIAVLISVGAIRYWHLLVTGAIQGMCFSINMPTRQSWIPSLVSRDDLANAIALNNAGMNASQVLGPAIAGLLIAIPWFGVNGVYYLRALAFCWVLYSLLKIPILGKPQAGTHKGRFIDEATAGARYVLKSDVLVPLFTLALVTLLLGQSYQALMPAIALGSLGVGSEGLGLMMTAVGIGALTGSLSMAYLSRSERKGRIQAIAGTTLGIGLTCFGLFSAVRLFGLVLASLTVVGASMSFYGTINNTLILSNTDRELQGRVMSIYMMTWALAPLSAAPFGALMDSIGGPPTLMIIGIVLTASVVGIARLHPGYRRLT
jgi:MFS family permease